LAPGISEIIGGSQCEERLAVLDRSVAGRGIDKEHCAPTVPSPASGGGLGRGDLCRYGTVPHAGFGSGLTLAYVTGLANVRDATPCSRTPGNARY
jgi:asparaginyl-tRNA synthetase